MTIHVVLGPDGRTIRRWRVTRSETFRLMSADGRLVATGGGAEMVEELPVGDRYAEPVEPFPGPRSVTVDLELTDAGRYTLGLGPHLTAAQQRGAVPLDPEPHG